MKSECRRLAFFLAQFLIWAPSLQAADLPRNQQPMYGGTPPSDIQKKSDQGFIEYAVRTAGSRKAASDETVSLGFDYLFKKRDPATAMQRFNQAWLLDPDNGSAFHGMALVVLIRDNNPRDAEPLFARAAAGKRQLPAIFMDYGRFLLMQRRPAEAVPVLLEGRKKFPSTEQGVAETEALLATAYAESGQIEKACTLARARQDVAEPALKDRLGEINRNSACAKPAGKAR